MPNAGSMTYWYLQAPSLIILAVVVLLLLRLALTPFSAAGTGLVRTLTQPVVAVVRAITPGVIPQTGVIVCAIIWLAAIRVLLVMAGLAVGARI